MDATITLDSNCMVATSPPRMIPEWLKEPRTLPCAMVAGAAAKPQDGTDTEPPATGPIDSWIALRIVADYDFAGAGGFGRNTHQSEDGRRDQVRCAPGSDPEERLKRPQSQKPGCRGRAGTSGQASVRGRRKGGIAFESTLRIC